MASVLRPGPHDKARAAQALRAWADMIEAMPDGTPTEVMEERGVRIKPQRPEDMHLRPWIEREPDGSMRLTVSVGYGEKGVGDADT